MRYMLFRGTDMLQKKSGIQRRKYKTVLPEFTMPNYSDWQATKLPFFIEGRKDLLIKPTEKDISDAKRILGGELPYFSWQWFPHNENTWLTNPLSGYTYELKHFSETPEFVAAHGDIKYLWEASRFSWVYSLMKYDVATNNNNDAFVFEQINSWIDHNPLNLGPNYICSQEISIRVLNWLYVLHFYANSEVLTDALWQKIIRSMAGQMGHVYQNRKFALIAVRNNHTLTEMLGLFVIGKMFPFMPNAIEWASVGKRHFEQEVDYQIETDGSYIQQSFNYQRVVVQLLTWALQLGALWEDKFNRDTYHKAKLCLEFLETFSQPENGHLPNYGANDGALFFPFNTTDHRDYRPQLNALAQVLDQRSLTGPSDSPWYGNLLAPSAEQYEVHPGAMAFEPSGYYTLKSKQLFGFVRCNNNQHRPSHADNLHFDLWANGQNILMDGGSYLYNTAPENTQYFFGSASHNTVMLDDVEQMEKGPRFVWLNWTKRLSASVSANKDGGSFQGMIEGFASLGKGIKHQRNIDLDGGKVVVSDKIIGKPAGVKMRQGWLINEQWHSKLRISSVDDKQSHIEPVYSTGWVSNYYGQKTKCQHVEFISDSDQITTKFSLDT